MYCKYVIGVGGRRGGGSEEGHSLEEAAVEIDLFIIYSFHLAIDGAAGAGLSDLALCHHGRLPLR